MYNLIFDTNIVLSGDGDGLREIYLNHVILKNINGIK